MSTAQPRTAASITIKRRRRRVTTQPLPPYLLGLVGPLVPAERAALRMIISQADVERRAAGYFLVIRATPALVDTLSAFEAEGADCELDADSEDEGDREAVLDASR